MSYVYNTTDNVTDVYPCEFGFHYLEVSGAVWLALLPFWICALFGNCWRQCCCCCCDPIVIGSTIIDFIQKCCCECGKVRVCEILWLIHCGFHLVWSAIALAWFIGAKTDNPVIQFEVHIDVEGWQVPANVLNTVLASIVLDILFAGSEVFHRVRLMLRKPEAIDEDADTREQNRQLNPQEHQLRPQQLPQDQAKQ